MLEEEGSDEEPQLKLVQEEEDLNRKKKKKERRIIPPEETSKGGVCYLSRIPPNMDPASLRHILSQYGEINRIYLSPTGKFQLVPSCFPGFEFLFMEIE